jgi:hypothetical protein
MLKCPLRIGACPLCEKAINVFMIYFDIAADNVGKESNESLHMVVRKKLF